MFFGNRNRLELHQKIRIASLRVEVPTQNGTKSREPPHPVLPAKASDVFEIAFEEAIDGAFEGRIALDGRFAQHVSLRKQYPLPNPQHPKLEWPTMFPYDPELLAAVQTTPQTIAEVASIMQAIDSHCVNGDGLKWFNLLYLQVTQAVEARLNANAFLNSAWMAALDVEFAGFYLRAIQTSLSGQSTPGCWQALFNRRNQTELARIQFAFAGMNAHINHDLPQAVLTLCRADQIEPKHGTPQYTDFTALNSALDSLIHQAEIDMHLRLLGDALPPVSDLDNKIAAWSMSAAREVAWDNAELLWRLSEVPPAFTTFLDSLDGTTALASEALLIPIP